MSHEIKQNGQVESPQENLEFKVGGRTYKRIGGTPNYPIVAFFDRTPKNSRELAAWSFSLSIGEEPAYSLEDIDNRIRARALRLLSSLTAQYGSERHAVVEIYQKLGIRPDFLGLREKYPNIGLPPKKYTRRTPKD